MYVRKTSGVYNASDKNMGNNNYDDNRQNRTNGYGFRDALDRCLRENEKARNRTGGTYRNKKSDINKEYERIRNSCNRRGF